MTRSIAQPAQPPVSFVMLVGALMLMPLAAMYLDAMTEHHVSLRSFSKENLGL